MLGFMNADQYRAPVLQPGGGSMIFGSRACAILVLALGVLEPFGAARAQVDGALQVAASVIGALTVGKIFNRANEAIDHAQTAAQTTSNRLLFSAVDQSRQMMKQLADTLAAERDTTFNQLSDARKVAIWDLYSVSLELEKGTADEFAKGVVQAQNLLANVQFIGKDVKFLIVRVMPTVFQEQAVSNNPVQIYAVGLGTDQAKKRFKRKISIAGRQISTDRISVKEWGVEVFLQKADFEGVWKSDEYSRAPMQVESTITEEGSWWCAWAGCTNRNTYSATYQIDLYPTRAAQLSVVRRTETEVPAGPEQWEKISITLPNMDGQGHLSYPPTASGPTSAGQDWKWSHWDAAHDGCSNISGNGCPFVRDQRCDFSGDMFIVQCSADNDGHSVLYQFGVLKKLYKMEQVKLPDQQLEIRPGESRMVEIERAAKSAWIEGILPTGQKFGPLSLIPPGGAVLDSVMCTGGTIVGDKRQFTCAMHEPR